MTIRDFMETTTMSGLRNATITFTDGVTDFSFTRDAIYAENWFDVVKKYYSRDVLSIEFNTEDGLMEVRLWIGGENGNFHV